MPASWWFNGRALIVALLALLAAPVAAEDWERYDNARYGYGLDIPPDYLGQGESDNGDGQEFQRRRGAQRLLVWGGLLGTANESFGAEVRSRMAQAQSSAWNLTYQATTQTWASFSAIKGGRILYQRMIMLCDRQSFAAFSLEYSVRDSAAMDGVVEKLVRTLRGACS